MSRKWSGGHESFLGINYNGMHDSSVCLVDAKGTLVYAVSEERFSGVKQDGRFPHLALRTLDLSGVRAVGVPYLEISSGPVASDPVFDGLLHPAPSRPVLPYPPVWREQLATLGLPLLHFDHHEMHAYTGYVLSGYEEALVLTGDYGAYSCPLTMGVFHISHGQIVKLAGASISEHEALAGLYTDVTALLGFSPCKHEGKITGLAALGRPDPECRRLVWELHRRIRAAEHRLYDWVGFLDDDVPPFYETNAYLVEHYRAQLPFSDADIARAAQDLLEEKLRVIGGWIADAHGTSLPLVLSGGLFANVRANLEIAKLGFLKVFVAPSMGDDGLSIGAAAAAWHAVGEGDPRRSRRGRPSGGSTGLTSMALGPPPRDDVDSFLTDLGVIHGRVEEPADELARFIADGQIVAVMRGRQEFGPRALGKRSILCGADDACINNRLNARLRRTEFMPFAPILRADLLSEIFCLDGISDVRDCLPHMTMCLPVQNWVKDVAPAVVHVDGTARPQVVTEASDPFLHRLLTRYEERTGIPVLINTSFNIHDEPLVSDADDAVVVFFLAHLDVLFLEGVIVEIANNRYLASVAQLTQRSSIAAGKLRHRALNRSFGRQIVSGPGRFSELSDTTALLLRVPSIGEEVVHRFPSSAGGRDTVRRSD